MVPTTRGSLPLHHRPLALLATLTARLLVLLKPRALRRVLIALRRGSDSATSRQALEARNAVVAVSASCAGEGGCLQRSVATVILCRMRGAWPDWCTGVRTNPFRAHAWVEVGGHPIGEPRSVDTYHKLLTVPSSPARR
ncbi:lasso peptide biosynthesis B2 protein [Nocardia sp. NPDC051570]|uniref:lasso peptide biosynthesis B2 protein n=1 Tax=Nocardia sp. NPDC051570 TaxID=3364324 RepID=UPI0037BDAB36